MWFVGSIKSAPCYNEVRCSQHSFPSISLYSCKSCLTLGNCSSVSNLEIDNSFTCHLHVHPQVESGMHAFIPQPQSINALLPVYFTDSVVVLRHARHKKVILETHTFTNQQHKINTNKCSAVAEMGDHLATIDMDRKLGAVPLMGGKLDSHVTQCGLPSYQVAS